MNYLIIVYVEEKIKKLYKNIYIYKYIYICIIFISFLSLS